MVEMQILFNGEIKKELGEYNTAKKELGLRKIPWALRVN